MIIPLGTYRLLLTNGSELTVNQKPTMTAIARTIGAKFLDSVNLRDGSVMILDDHGMAKELPPNPAATALYHSVCKPGTTHQIRGDVAIVMDEDFV